MRGQKERAVAEEKGAAVMRPNYSREDVRLYRGDMLRVLPELEPESFTACVCDPPYHLTQPNRATVGSKGFMGKAWDGGDIAFQPDTWRAVMRVLKPGAMLLAFGGDRTHHRVMCAIEDAGFEIRTCIYWVFGQGFPKSLDISKAIEEAAGVEREVVGMRKLTGKARILAGGHYAGRYEEATAWRETYDNTAPATPLAKLFSGYGTALKPAAEIIIVAMKPLDKNFAHNAERHGVSGINIDGCRVPTSAKSFKDRRDDKVQQNAYGKYGVSDYDGSLGRWPSNLILDDSDEVLRLFPMTHGAGTFREGSRAGNTFGVRQDEGAEYQRAAIDGGGSAARFFYCCKASQSERDAGCQDLEAGLPVDGADKWTEQDRRKGAGVTRRLSHNTHPTCKPLDLMRYLCRLVTPPANGLILDPFLGSGTTGLAAIQTGNGFVGVELEKASMRIAVARIKHELNKPSFRREFAKAKQPDPKPVLSLWGKPRKRERL